MTQILDKNSIDLGTAAEQRNHDGHSDETTPGVCADATPALDKNGFKGEDEAKASDTELVPKRRKTRRGKSKRRHPHPYRKTTKNNIIKAPYNSNRFLIEDHGDDCIDAEFKRNDQASTSTVTRTRDSSISMDSDGEFYSTPEDEDVFLIRDFDDEYEGFQAERLQSMSKDQLIREFLLLEGKVELLTKRLFAKNGSSDLINGDSDRSFVNMEIERLTIENESLRRENEALKSKLEPSSDSADSETDSSDSCSSSSSSNSRPESPVDCQNTNGHVEAESLQSG